MFPAMFIQSRFMPVLAFALAAAPVSAFAEGQMTVLNSHSLVKFESCSLRVNRLDFEKQATLSDHDVLRICESLDNSRFCYVGSLFDREHTIAMYRPFFAAKAIRQSMTEFLRRGGMVFFAPVTLTQFGAWPREMTDYFASVGVTLPGPANFENNVIGSDKERSVFAKATDGWRDSLFNAPRNVDPVQAIRHFKDPAAIGYETVFASSEGFPVVISAKTKLGGTVVFSHVYSVERRLESPFFLNVLQGLYGEAAVRRRSSRTAYIDAAKARGKTELCVREVPAYQRVYTDTPVPDGGEELTHIDLLLARGDREIAKIAFFNCSDENLEFRLEPDADRTNRDIFSFYEARPWRTEAGPVVNETVVPVNGANLVSVPSGETRTILLVGETRRAPGKYDWSCELVPANLDIPTRKITVTAEVLDLEIDPACLPMTYMWGPYNNSHALGLVERYREFLVNGKRVRLVQAGSRHWEKLLRKKPDGSVHVVPEAPGDLIDDEIAEKRAGRRWVSGYGMLGAFWTRMKALGGDPDVTNPVTMKLFADGIRLIDAAYRRAGITPDDFYEPLKDEPSAKEIPQMLAAGRFVRSLGWKVCVDIATWCTMDDIRALAPIVDWWQPWERRLVDRASGPDEIAYYRSTGKTVTPYLCSMSGNTDPYLEYHRFRGIRSFWMGYDGFGTWAANSWRGNDYRGKDNALDGRNGQYPGSFYVHHGDFGPVGTMRLEAWREGAEDYHWLKYAEKRGLAADLRSEATLRKLNAACDPAATKAWRDRLLRALADDGALVMKDF